jgi:hypothetical protein
MPESPEQTDTVREVELGRVALWLDPADLEWLGSAGHCTCGPDTSEEDRARCERIHFRASAALHKTGLKQESR